jgi:hypothetical protein
MKLSFAVLAALALAACPPPPDTTDAGTDAGPVANTGCVDRPGELAKAPNGQLPCELFPPGSNR